jgi:cytochrome c oxidase subunit 2
MKPGAVLSRGPWLAVFAGSTSVLWSCSGNSSPSVTDPHSPQTHHIAGLFWLMFWMGTVIYVLVLAIVAASFRNRSREDRHSVSAAMPPASERTRARSARFIIVGGLALPVVVLSVVGISTIRTTNAAQPGSAPMVKINVEADRWWWRLTYPDDHIVTANEIHVPVGVPVELTLTSDDVIHSVWVPQLDGKTDVVPGQTNHMSFTADMAGTYLGECAEFCGIAHAKMAFVVIVDSAADYARWVQSTQRPAQAAQGALAQQGAALFMNSSCAGCHAVNGSSATGTRGPDLTHFGSRTSIAAMTLPNTPSELTRWLAHTQDVKHGALMPQIDLTDEQVAALVAYLEGLR